MIRRRAFLAALGGTTAALAGCLDSARNQILPEPHIATVYVGSDVVLFRHDESEFNGQINARSAQMSSDSSDLFDSTTGGFSLSGPGDDRISFESQSLKQLSFTVHGDSTANVFYDGTLIAEGVTRFSEQFGETASEDSFKTQTPDASATPATTPIQTAVSRSPTPALVPTADATTTERTRIETEIPRRTANLTPERSTTQTRQTVTETSRVTTTEAPPRTTTSQPTPPEQSVSANASNALMAHYKFENGGANVTDVSTNGYHGKLVDGAIGQAAERSGSVLDLDGNNDGVKIPVFGSQDSFGVSLWFNPVQIENGWQMLVKWRHVGVAHRYGELFGHYYDRAQNGRRAIARISDSVIKNGEWSHVGYTYTDGIAHLYFNGEQVDETRDRITVDNRPTEFSQQDSNYIGYHGGNTGAYDPYFAGQIDDVRLYSQALSSQDMAEIYQAEQSASS